MMTWWTQLINAIDDGNLDEIKHLISTRDLSHLVEWPSNDMNYSASDLLCNAISKNHTGIAEELLKCGIPVNEPSKRGFAPPLHMAVIKENIKIIDMILERNADVFVKHRFMSPLKFAVARKNVIIAERLLNHVAYLNSAPNCVRRVYGSQSAFIACSQQSDELFELFLSRDSEIFISSTEKTELLNLAARLESPNLIKVLVKYGADINAEAEGVTALRIAVERKDLATVECILEFCPDINRNMRILHRSLEGQYSEDRNMIVNVLLRYGFTVHPEDTTDGELLNAAIKWGRLDIVEALLKYGADVNAYCQCLQGSTFLHVSAENRRFEIAKTLIKHGADVNMKHMNSMIPPIYTAVRNLDVDITRLFLSSGAIIANMSYLLSMAFQINGMKMVEFLLQYDTKFDINAILSNGETILNTLVYSPIYVKQPYGAIISEISEMEDSHKAEMAELCLRRGAIVDLKSTYGDTALFAAVCRELPLVVEKLLEHGADVDAQHDSYENMTPLMIAVIKDSLNVVKSLTRSRPNSEIRDSYGKMALHYAVKFASPSIVQELLDYGADINATSKDNATPYSCGDATASNRAVLELHMDMRKAQNLYVNSKNLEQFNLQGGLYDDCKREIEEMKRSKISDSNISFYHVLTKSAQNLVNYVRNENIASALNEKNDYEKKFPVYFAMIHHRFIKSIKLEALLTLGTQSIDSLIGFNLPDVASMNLLGYLSIDDLKNLIKARYATE